MSRTVIAYAQGHPIYRDDGPAKARLVGFGALQLGQALTSVTVAAKRPSKPVPERPTCGRWMPKLRVYCARTPEHRSECRSAAMLERHRQTGR